MTPLRRLAAVPLLTLVFATACAPPATRLVAETLPSAIGDSADAVRVAAHLDFLASDELAGRDTVRPEGQITGRYVASVFRTAGLEPGNGRGGFLQVYPLVSTRLDADATSVALSGGGERADWALGDDCVVAGYAPGGVSLDAPLTFAGHGIVADWADVDDLEGLALDGRVAVVLEGRPDDHDELRGASSWRAKREVLRERGAVGMVRVVDLSERGEQRTWDWMRRATDSTSVGLPGVEPFPVVLVEADALAPWFARAGRDLPAEIDARSGTAGLGGFGLGDARIALDWPAEVEELQAYNTVGLLRGSDPALRDEMIVLSAHMDHIGVSSDGSVNNGADDNASGTTTVLAVAQRLAEGLPLRRSVLFLTVSGEEKGLLGSKWFVDNPPFPIGRMVANVNIDMVGRNDPDSIGLTPSPEHPEFNTLVTRAIDVGERVGFEVRWTSGEGEYEQPVDNLYHRSDHANFADAGVPVAFFFSGLHEDYHKPSDTLEKLDQRKITRMVELVAELVREVADADGRPERLGVADAADD